MTGVAVRPAGDRAVLLEVAGTGEALRVAHHLRESCPELTEVVPGHRTVLAVWDAAPEADLAALAAHVLSVPGTGASPRTVEVPVAYDGPDLDEVAALTGLSPEEVVARHTASEYLVGFIGFAPGFAYLVGLDERLRVPRRREPRVRVPGGAVAVAGPYSGIYPRESPGGWRLIGRTEIVLFDESRAEPATLAPGDRVRMVAA